MMNGSMNDVPGFVKTEIPYISPKNTRKFKYQTYRKIEEFPTNLIDFIEADLSLKFLSGSILLIYFSFIATL